MLKRNYDLVATVSTAAVFTMLNVPWPLWAAWGLVVTYQFGNRIINGWSR